MKASKYFSLVVFAIAITFCTNVNGQDQSKAIKIQTLLLDSLSKEFTPDREVRIDLVEFPPDTVLEWHRHPGEEFHYYLEGEVEIQIEGKPTIYGKPGGVAHIPYLTRHRAITHEKGAKVLVFRVHTNGKPWKYDDIDHNDK